MRLLLSLLLVRAHAAAAVQQPWPLARRTIVSTCRRAWRSASKSWGQWRAAQHQRAVELRRDHEVGAVPRVELRVPLHQHALLATANFSFPDYVQYVEELYGNLTEQTASTCDQFMDFHLGMIVDDMTPYYAALRQNNFPFFMVGQYPSFFDLFVEIPGTGHILELTSERLDDPNANISGTFVRRRRSKSS